MGLKHMGQMLSFRCCITHLRTSDMEKWTALFMQIIVPVKCLNEISILFAIVRVYSKSIKVLLFLSNRAK